MAKISKYILFIGILLVGIFVFMAKYYDFGNASGYYYIDENFKPITKKTFYEAFPFSEEGIAKVVICDGPIAYTKYINVHGEYLFDNAEYLIGSSFSDGYARVGSKRYSESTYAIIDSQGRIITEIPSTIYIEGEKYGIYPYYQATGWGFDFRFQQGAALVQYWNTDDSNNKFGSKYLYGYISHEGDFVIKPQFKYASPFSEYGIALVGNGKLYGYIDTNNNFVIPYYYKNAKDFSLCGLAPVQDQYGKWGYINISNEYILPAIYIEANTFDENGFAAVSTTGNYWKIINTDGIEITEEKYVEIHDCINGYFAVKDKNQKWGILNTEGILIIPCMYENISNVSKNGLIAAKFGELWGYIDINNNWIQKPKYHYASSFENGFAIVKK